MSKWLDSHCHINGREYYDDLGSVLDNMVFSDVSKCMIDAFSIIINLSNKTA